MLGPSQHKGPGDEVVLLLHLLLLILGKGACDFDTDSCGWREDSGSGDSYWRRTAHEETEETLNLARLGKCWKFHQVFVLVCTNSTTAKYNKNSIYRSK